MSFRLKGEILSNKFYGLALLSIRGATIQRMAGPYLLTSAPKLSERIGKESIVNDFFNGIALTYRNFIQ